MEEVSRCTDDMTIIRALAAQNSIESSLFMIQSHPSMVGCGEKCSEGVQVFPSDHSFSEETDRDHNSSISGSESGSESHYDVLATHEKSCVIPRPQSPWMMGSQNKSSDRLHSYTDGYLSSTQLSDILFSPVEKASKFGGSMTSFVSNYIEKSATASFLVRDLRIVENQLKKWHEELPMVEPFYAVKCNPSKDIVKVLGSLGCNFDCATEGEIKLVTEELGFDASRVVYANPAKMRSMLSYAHKQGVYMTVFDGEDELHKIASLPNDQGKHFELLLRITTDDKSSVCQFSKKFGCPPKQAPHLLRVAHSLGLTVVGVSFHVGSGCGDAEAYATALNDAAGLFKFTKEELPNAVDMHLVDIGGGFPGDAAGHHTCDGMPSFQQLASTIRRSIDEFRVAVGDVHNRLRFIAEPGRYFVSACTTVATKIMGRKGGSGASQALYVDDGVYGTFNNVVYDHYHPQPVKVQLSDNYVSDNVFRCVSSEEASETSQECVPTAIFGPTCDGLDQLTTPDECSLTRCYEGEWLMFHDMGAYTHTASFIFNGYTHFPNAINITTTM